MPEFPSPPRHLSRKSKTLWRKVVRDYSLEDHHLAMLTTALEAYDRMNEARAILDAEGCVYRDRFNQPRKHPAVSVEENARIQFLRALRELDLEAEPLPDPRPPRRS